EYARTKREPPSLRIGVVLPAHREFRLRQPTFIEVHERFGNQTGDAVAIGLARIERRQCIQKLDAKHTAVVRARCGRTQQCRDTNCRKRSKRDRPHSFLSCGCELQRWLDPGSRWARLPSPIREGPW